MNNTVRVIGAGLAGCEAAWALANNGIRVELYEMKPGRHSPAHKSNGFAELVCSNSLKAIRTESAAGLLKAEMRKLGSICLESAEKNSVPAGGALAVERNAFSDYITDKIKSHPNIKVIEECVEKIPDNCICIVATGPLTDNALAQSISNLLGSEYLSFYDAAAPIVSFDSINTDKAFYASRYGRGDASDYINCPLNKEQYETFHSELVNAERAPLHEFDKKISVYEGCMPIEILAARGQDTMRFGPMKPVGLTDPATGHRPWAVLQLRKENRQGTMYNLVGFQTNLKFSEQKRVFSLIPALENAEFFRYGVMHRNSFIDSPKLLNGDLSLEKNPNIYFAGQITGVEGYMESAAAGIIAGFNAAMAIKGKSPFILPGETMIGALLEYITDKSTQKLQPMGASFGVLPPLKEKIKDKKQRYAALAGRALACLDDYLKKHNIAE